MNYTKVYRANTAYLVQSWKEDGAFEFWNHQLGYLNVKRVHALKNMLSGMHFRKIPCTASSILKT